MAEQDPGRGRPPGAPGTRGIASSLRALSATVIEHGRLRFQMIEVEGRDAVLHYLRMAVVLGVGLVFLLFAYLFLLVGGVFLLADATGLPWSLLTAAVGGGHLILALVLLIVAKTMLRKPVLEGTINELKRDTEWLRNQANKDTTSKTI